LLALLPIIIADARHHPAFLPICIITIFLGGTMIGWVVALVWACIPLDRPLTHY
jgi:hypothetical protein